MNRTLRGHKVLTASHWIAGVVASATLAMGGGYLSEDGPPPLRFGSRPRIAGAKVPLPPLALVTPETVDTTNDLASGTNSISDPTLDLAEESTHAGESLNLTSESTSIPPPAATIPPSLFPGMTVTPQVLLSYFGSTGSNGVNPVVMAPVSFVPPQPGAPASSRATYRKVP